MWGIAIAWHPRHWRIGAWNAVNVHPLTGREIIVGRWFCLGPVALCYDYE